MYELHTLMLPQYDDIIVLYHAALEDRMLSYWRKGLGQNINSSSENN